MFSGALKSFSSNITSNYTIEPQPSSAAGPWKIFSAKQKRSSKAVSVFVCDKKSLDAGSSNGFSGKGSSSSLKRAQEEVLERLKREASNLARLRHPSILELAEPVEETRNGGLMFATEPVTASLASILAEKDDQEQGGSRGRGSKFMVEEQDGTRRKRELEIDELEIQKGLLQLGKGLEFLHNAGLVHANLTPDAVMINAKGDWKIAGLGFCGPYENSTAPTSLIPISLHEALNYDPRLPRHVQLDLQYASPDFVLDNSLVASADMFSLGLLILALYNLPHTSPISVGGSVSSYKRVFSSPATIPSKSNNFLIPSSQNLPPRLSSELLPRLITRRAAQRMTAREFQDASYFDNILVSTLRFMEALPAKTPQEKAAFFRGLKGIMNQFPSSVLEKKILPALLEEMKDKELLAPVLIDVFEMIKTMSNGKPALTEQVVPRLREVFIMNRPADRDASREAGLMIVLQSMPVIASNCAGKEFRDDILPIVLQAMDSQIPSLVDASLSTLPSMLTVLDFSTIKNELFPVVASGFSKTNSLAIKIKGLEAFYILCGGDLNTPDNQDVDDLSGVSETRSKRQNASAILDKYTVQEKIVPLMKVIKTKEPGVMMAALRVFRQVGEVADIDFLAMEALPILWSFSLGPLLSLQQFQAFMTLIKSIGSRIEREHARKLSELSTGDATANAPNGNGSRMPSATGSALQGMVADGAVDFETLVSGRKSAVQNDDLMNDWGSSNVPIRAAAASPNPSAQPSITPAFSWQMPAGTVGSTGMKSGLMSSVPTRTNTADQSLNNFSALTPASPWSTPLQPAYSANNTTSTVNKSNPAYPGVSSVTMPSSVVDWSAASSSSSAAWASAQPIQPKLNSFGQTIKPSMGSFIPPPPAQGPQPVMSGMAALALQPSNSRSELQNAVTNNAAPKPRSGLARYESLI